MELTSRFIAADDPKHRSLMVVLHGLGDSLEGFRWLPTALGLPWLNILLVNAPDPYLDGWSWYDFMGDPEPGIVQSRQHLHDLLETQREKGFPPNQTLLFGFSQGALMTFEMGVRYPYVLGGCIAISGYIHQPERLVREASPAASQQRFLATHGHEDPLLPIAMVRDQIQYLQKAGLKITWKEFNKSHTIAGEAELQCVREFIKARLQSDSKETPDGRTDSAEEGAR